MKKRLSVLVLAIAMVLTMSASVFATGDGANSGKNQGADSYLPESASLVKYLQMPEGLNDPGETFTFTFTRTAPTNAVYGVPVDNTWADTSTTITSASMTAVTTGNAADTGNKVGTKTIESIFENYSFPRAGEYTFTVAETAGSKTGMTYASDTYTLRLVVNNDKEITDVTVQKGTDGDKVDPTDVDPTDNGDDVAPADSKGGFTFTNSYTKDVDKHDEPKTPNPNEDPDDPDTPDPIQKDEPNLKEADGAFVLDKFVLGEYGDQTKDFAFTVTVTLPKLSKNFDFTKTGNVPTVTADKGSISGTWGDGTAVTVNLKHGGQLNFPNLPVGTKINVKEAGVDGYYELMTTKDAADADATVQAGYTVTVTEDEGGYAICRNSFDDESITPTGIIINNLPYVLLIGLALGGIVLFSRKRRYE